MRTQTSYNDECHLKLDGVGDLLGENMRSGAIDGACEFTGGMLPALLKVVEHPDVIEELAAIPRR